MKTKVVKTTSIAQKLCTAGVLIALAMVLPFFTGSIPEIGGMLCPMHLPAFLLGAFCGPIFGGVCAFVTPIIRGLIFGSPILFPRGISMAFELFAYAALFGSLTRLLPNRLPFIYLSLGAAMIAGRIVGGISKLILLGLGFIGEYSMALFVSGYFIETLPGAIIQLLIIPYLLYALRKSGSAIFSDK